jgi:predicted DNA-binding transcriptional regulator AlpA
VASSPHRIRDSGDIKVLRDQSNETPLHPNGKTERLLRSTEVLARLGCSRPTLYRCIKSGIIPKPYSLTGKVGGAVAWKESEISAFIASRQHASDLVEVR